MPTCASARATSPTSSAGCCMNLRAGDDPARPVHGPRRPAGPGRRRAHAVGDRAARLARGSRRSSPTPAAGRITPRSWRGRSASRRSPACATPARDPAGRAASRSTASTGEVVVEPDEPSAGSRSRARQRRRAAYERRSTIPRAAGGHRGRRRDPARSQHRDRRTMRARARERGRRRHRPVPLRVPARRRRPGGARPKTRSTTPTAA